VAGRHLTTEVEDVPHPVDLALDVLHKDGGVDVAYVDLFSLWRTPVG